MESLFCAVCDAEVEDVGGFCMLGHPLRDEDLAGLRAEVDRAFEDARLQVTSLLSHTASVEPPPPPPPARVPPPPPLPALFDGLDAEDLPRGADPISAFAPSPRMDWGPQDKGGKLRRKARDL